MMSCCPLYHRVGRNVDRCYLVNGGRYSSLEALPVDNAWAGLVILLLGDPHLLEGGQRGQDGSSDPDGVLPLRGSDDLDLHGGWGKSSDLLLHSAGNTGVHGGATGQDGVGVQVLPDVNIALHDGVVGGLVDTTGLHTQERRLEESLRAPEPLIADGDDLTVGKLVGLLEGAGGGSGGHLLLEVQGDVAELLLDVTDNLALSGGGERVATLGEDLHEMISEVTASQVEPEDGVGESVSLVDGDSVGDTITRVEHNTGGTARGVEGEDSLDSDVHGGGVEGLKHDLCHLLPVGLGVEGSLGQEDGVLLGGNSELVVEGVVPDLLHVVPVGHDTVLNGVLQGEDSSLALGLISDIRVLLSHADHDSLMPRPSDDGGEHGPGGVISGEPGLAHTGAVVNDQSGNFIVTHFAVCIWFSVIKASRCSSLDAWARLPC